MQALSLDLIDAARYKVQLPGTGAGPAFENYRSIAYSCPIDDWRRRVENFLRTRIRTRLDALGLNPFEAARRIPAERTFLNDLLIGKKSTIRQSAIPKVAAALECDPEYLLGAQDTPRRNRAQAPEKSPENAPSGITLVGIAEAGTWRVAAHSGAVTALPISPDPRHPATEQIAVLVRGDHAAGLGAGDGSVVVGVKGAAFRDGDIVLVRRSRDLDHGQEEEITVRRINGAWLECNDAGSVVSRIAVEGAEIIARAISAHKIF